MAPAAVFGSGNAAAEEAKPQEDVSASADPGHDDQPQGMLALALRTCCLPYTWLLSFFDSPGSAQSHDTGLTDW